MGQFRLKKLTLPVRFLFIAPGTSRNKWNLCSTIDCELEFVFIIQRKSPPFDLFQCVFKIGGEKVEIYLQTRPDLGMKS